ncbi:uncharacterized protein EI97DRAFT_402079 [Westerdykella ornata]|uniref:Uncharacterized protein n=1 Tax=Westerdykella ornata TaxID=318751 RepID=A0A6A6JFX4_WESOR|nr:uncharacterized protein EI97DRAFT_402079 [Westerdykella ornata]KAF2274526.1 hypothetical protein EI97DRAFT_402079 [Westerdykella ornata]
MTSTLSSAASNPTGATCATQPYSQLPTNDVACAVAHASAEGLPSNYTSLMESCCKKAPVEKFANDCGLYCLSIDQSVADLTRCFQDAGIQPGWIFCNGNNTASATATGAPSKTGGGAGATGGATGTGEPRQTGAAGVVNVRQSVSKAGLGVVAMLVVSAVFGTM